VSNHRRACGICLALALALAAPDSAPAQAKVRPGDQRPPLEPFAPEEQAAPPLALPPAPTAPPDQADRLAAQGRVFVAGFTVEGSTVFTPEQLELLVAPWSGRPITSEELLAARDAITQHYVAHGYITSGAVVPDQDVADGIIAIHVVEGALTDVEVSGVKRFRSSYFRSRLRHAARAPLNVFALERELQMLQQDPWVERVKASLHPGERRGESWLAFDVEEAQPYELWASYSNEQSPSIGSDGGGPSLKLANLAGMGDELSLDFTRTRGLRDLEARYSLPFSTENTTLDLEYRNSESEVVIGEFQSLDLVSDYVSYTVRLRHPAVRNPYQELWVGLEGEWHKSTTRIFDDERISLAPGADNGDSIASVLRFPIQYTQRSRAQVFALRSTLSLGWNVMGASNVRGEPDSRFTAWLGQVNFARRLPERFWSTDLVARLDAQFASSELLTIEQFAMGGMHTVRGYAENSFVRDNGVVGSLEFRVPILRDGLGRRILELAPFVDVGRSYDKNGTPLGFAGDKNTLSSWGLGLRFKPTERVLAELYWGDALRDVPDVGRGIQNHGWHFRVSTRAF
jgi:hemolysin activation/secretion protein